MARVVSPTTQIAHNTGIKPCMHRAFERMNLMSVAVRLADSAGGAQRGLPSYVVVPAPEEGPTQYQSVTLKQNHSHETCSPRQSVALNVGPCDAGCFNH
jgi:hypothetical protein